MTTQTGLAEARRSLESVPVSRRAVYVAAGLSLVIAVVYLLIGLRVLEVIDPIDDQPAFGFTAAGFFLMLAVVLVVIRHRIVWILAGLVQVFVIFTYFDLADRREPSFEPWGITLRVLQVPLLIALGWLVWHGRATDADEVEIT